MMINNFRLVQTSMFTTKEFTGKLRGFESYCKTKEIRFENCLDLTRQKF